MLAVAHTIAIDLSAVIVAVTDDEPRVLTIHGGGALPSGPFISAHSRLELGLRAWVAEQTGLALGYVEQLYTFADRDRMGSEATAARAVSVSYLALVREAKIPALSNASWQNWYRYFPYEDRRDARDVATRANLLLALKPWLGSDPALRRFREERTRIAFGGGVDDWDGERALDRYELLYEAQLVDEALPNAPGSDAFAQAATAASFGAAMRHDHRRILATALSRLRGKLKYRPVIFELMPPSFTLLQLQRAVEALAGVGLHKQNFRRLIEQQGLVEETGDITTATGGRPAKQVRFRRDVVVERAAPGVRLPGNRSSNHRRRR